MFLRNSHKANKNFRLMLNEIKNVDGAREQVHPVWQSKEDILSPLVNQHRHQEQVNYGRLHQLVLQEGKAVEETYKVIRGYSEKAIKHLELFPPSESKEALVNICESLYKK